MILKDKVAIITGSAGGIGAAYALGYAKEGAKLVISDIVDGAETVAAVENTGTEAIFVKCDISKQEECDALTKAAMDRFGKIDVLINNAAHFGGLVLRPFTSPTRHAVKPMPGAREIIVSTGTSFRQLLLTRSL